MLPGTALALLFVRPPLGVLMWQTLLGLLSLCLCSSAPPRREIDDPGAHLLATRHAPPREQPQVACGTAQQ